MFQLPETLVGNQYLEVLRILVPPQKLVPYLFLENLIGTTYVQLINFKGHTHKSDFDIYNAVTIFNFLEKVVENQYRCGESYNISSLSDFTFLWKV